MFSKQDTTFKSQNGGYKKYVYATLGASAAMLGGYALYNNTQDEFNSELLELADQSSAETMAHFYNDLASGCDTYYSNASKGFASDAHDYVKIMDNLEKHKHIMMNYGREEFHTVKGSIFSMADSFIDSQRAIESVYSYVNGRLGYMKKRVTDDRWAF